MKQIIVGMFMSSLMTSVMYAASYDLGPSIEACMVLQKIIRERSSKNFKKQASRLQQLQYDNIVGLNKQCATYLHALDVMCEMREKPQIKCELEKMVQESEHEEQIFCCQMLWNFLQMLWNLFPNHARDRAIELSDLTYHTSLGRAIEAIKSEFIVLSDEELFKKVAADKIELRTIKNLLEQEQDTWEVEENSEPPVYRRKIVCNININIGEHKGSLHT